MLIMGILTGSLKARSLATLYDIKSSDNKSAMKNKIYQHFQSVVSLDVHIEQDKKLKTYALFKTNFKFEPYLDIFSDYNIRCNFAKLRLSAHNLHIETGRYGSKKTPRDERYCLTCKSNGLSIVEDEVHFLLNCPLYIDLRKNMLNPILQKYPSVKLLSEEKLFILLLSQEDTYTVTRPFTRREKTIKQLNPSLT